MFGVSLKGFKFEDDNLTFTLAAGITIADVGKAVEIDTTTPNTVKLATDDGVIFGRLEVVEDRANESQLVGTIARKFSDTLPVASGENIAIGDMVIGAGAGEVKAKGVPAGWERTIAVEADDNDLVVVQHGMG